MYHVIITTRREEKSLPKGVKASYSHYIKRVVERNAVTEEYHSVTTPTRNYQIS